MKIAKEKRSAASAMLIFVLVAAALSAPAFAQSQCLDDVSTTASASRATTGTSVTITVTTSGSSCTVQTLSIVSSPSLTVNDPASGQYAGFAAGTAKTFTVTAGTTGTYTYYARGTTSGGSRDSTSTPIEFIAPSDLTVTASPSSASVTQGNTFSLTIDIQNPSASDVSTSYAINLPSGLTRNAGDVLTSSGTTVSASSTKRLSLTIAHTTCMTSGTITFDLGSSTGVASVSVTGNSTCASGSTGTSSSTSGGGGGGATIKTTKTYSTGKATISVPVIYAGATESVNLTPTETNVNKIDVTVKGIARTITIVIEMSKLPLNTLAAPGTVAHYLSITKQNLSDENVQSAKLDFQVEKSWISGNKIDENTIALYRYTTSWTKMTTTKVSSDSTYVYYSAALPGLSLFAVSGEKTAEGKAEEAAQNQTQQEQPPAEQPPTNQTTEQPAQQPQAGLDAAVLTVIIVAIVAVAGAVYYMVTKKKPKGYSYKPSK